MHACARAASSFPLIYLVVCIFTSESYDYLDMA